MKKHLVAFIVLGTAFYACGKDNSKKAAGAACTLTQAGAAECASGLCATIQCDNGSTYNVCAGSDCAQNACGSTETCLAFQGNGSWCFPNSVCTGNTNTKNDFGKKCDGPQDCSAEFTCDSETGSPICTKVCVSDSECYGGTCVQGDTDKWCKP